MPKVLIVIFVILILLLLVRANVVYFNRVNLRDMIRLYRVNCYANGIKTNVGYDHMEPYWKTFIRLWDFGYDRILPSYEYNLIKPYLDEVEKRNRGWVEERDD